jgi:phosphoenolpyruvate carboxylase
MDDQNRRRLSQVEGHLDVELWQQEILNWQRDDERWQQEISDWLHQTQRLVALLYMLEKVLPEHSSQLDQHKVRIDRHNEELSHYRHGLEKVSQRLATTEFDQQQQLHVIMGMNHHDMRREHEKFSKDYRNKMQQFRDLAQRLLNELDEFS